MTHDEHLVKARRIVASLEKLSLESDAMCVIDGAVIAGYNLGNALLHRHGVLPDVEHANTPSKLPVAPAQLPTAIQPAFAAFTELERLRLEHVRSPGACDTTLAKRAWQLLDEIRHAAS